MSSPCLSDFALDRLVTDEPDATSERAHVAGCAACAARLDALRREADAFRADARLPPLVARTEQAVASVSSPRRRRIRRWASASVTALAAAAALLLLWTRPPPPELRAKGGLQLDVFCKRPSGRVEQLLLSGSAAAGDALRFAVATPLDGFVAVLSVDAAGAVSSYAPDAPALAPIAAGPSRALDGSVELDETVGRERLIALVCKERLPTARVVEAVRAELDRVHGDAEHLDVARATPGCTSTTFWLTKLPRS
jgi:hypothetical protein